ncbi:MAG: DNA polymerase III subunit delta [Zoogloeaceae bacterium]|jgi:DNA polymerase-3 subunit delta|nr:DNA polymerase III subunit delta [Zoogloeaceae bacterium]
MQFKGEQQEQLAAHLAKRLSPLYVVYGDAPLLVLEAADAIRSAARQQGYGEREVLTALPGFDWGELAAASQSLSLFGERKIIELRIPSGKPGVTGGAALQAACKRLSPDNILLITLPQLDWKDEKTTWFTALSQEGVVLKLNTPLFADLPDWIAKRLARQRQETDGEGLRFMAERLEGNLLAAHQEIQKLALLYPPGKLSVAQIRDAVLNVARYRIDDMREAMLAGDLARLARTIEGLRQEGEAPPLVLWAFSEEIRAIARFKSGQARGQSVDALYRELRLWGLRQALVRRAAEALSNTTLKESLAEAARLDRQMKGMESSGSGDVWDGFLRLGLALCARTAPAARATRRA